MCVEELVSDRGSMGQVFEMQLMEQANIESAEMCPAFEMEVQSLLYGGGKGGASSGGHLRVGEKGHGEWKVDIQIPEREMLKYKKVANHTKPVATTLPEEYRIKCYPIKRSSCRLARVTGRSTRFHARHAIHSGVV